MGHVLDLFFFSSKRSASTKIVWFVIWAGAVLVQFWWFKGLALGVHGPIDKHWGLKWRSSWNVSGCSRVVLTSDVPAVEENPAYA